MPQAEMQRSRATSEDTNDLQIALPEKGLNLEQDAEWCVIRDKKGWREIRFHDYSEVYDVPGLYERLFYDILKCESPRVIRRLLTTEAKNDGIAASRLRVLDLGAGNGMVGEELADEGVKHIVGVDIIESAKEAAHRDRPGVYRDYLITDMTALCDEDRACLQSHKLNALTCVAALGFGDIPTKAFVEAWNLIADGGWAAFNIKDAFLNGEDSSGFSRLIQRMIDDGTLQVRVREHYRHRLATNGDPLYYVAMVGTKHAEVSE